MSDSEELEALREQRLRELQDTVAGDADDGETDSTSPDEPVPVTGVDHLDELTATRDLVLVDYKADWCGPCKMLKPTLETIASDTDVTVASVDIDAHPQLAERAGVRGVPTLVLFADGEPAEQLVGVQDEGTLRQLIDRYS